MNRGGVGRAARLSIGVDQAPRAPDGAKLGLEVTMRCWNRRLDADPEQPELTGNVEKS